MKTNVLEKQKHYGQSILKVDGYKNFSNQMDMTNNRDWVMLHTLALNEENNKSIKPNFELQQRHNHFEDAYLLMIEQKTDYCMKELKPYLEHDCNLYNFSVLIKIPFHHLAYYFREIKKQHFNDYRNSFRIIHAKNYIREGKANELTLEAIGLLSGFSTRNTFLVAFKKAEGISPCEYTACIKECNV